ncbi:hypothetical protein JKP75_18190 [Blastococcus sp. TML/M2B]|uniref:hypothetical protein n=1 Tax=Blastococcus sp. TML/M2B TaxID=2798727 RepID=UPI00190B3AA3|nr:hypothetical protein [Blastococcus sp. TML/M2B]MBN1094310.1 hypothetical protein [Blastococcus sp. TML/M2B]
MPAEPAVRQAASGLIGAQLVHLDRQRRWAPAFFVLMGVLSAFLAITGSPWWWAAVPAWALAAAGHLWMRAHLRRRAALLSEVS